MAKDPAVLWYTSDFLTGTMTMTDEQVGRYARLLCLQHQKGVLTEKDMIIICKSYDKEVFDKFVKSGDFFYNERMKKEAEKRSAFSKSRSENRLNGIENKELKKKKNKISHDYHMENENENENENKDLDLNLESVKEKKQDFGTYKNIRLYLREYERLSDDIGAELTNACIEYLSAYKREKPYKTRDDNLTIRRWVIQAVMEGKMKIEKINKNGEKLSKNQSIRNSAEEAKRLIDKDIANADSSGEACY